MNAKSGLIAGEIMTIDSEAALAALGACRLPGMGIEKV